MEEKVLIIRGRRIGDEELGFIRGYVRLYFSEGRMGIARRICERWGWRESKGSLKVAGTMDVWSMKFSQPEGWRLPYEGEIKYKMSLVDGNS